MRKFPQKCQKIAGCWESAVYGSRPPIASKPDSSSPERPGLDNITSQPWSKATCLCTTSASTYLRFVTIFLVVKTRQSLRWGKKRIWLASCLFSPRVFLLRVWAPSLVLLVVLAQPSALLAFAPSGTSCSLPVKRVKVVINTFTHAYTITITWLRTEFSCVGIFLRRIIASYTQNWWRMKEFWESFF